MYKVSTEDEDAGSVLKRSVNENTNKEYWEAADDDVYVVNPATGLHIRAASSKKKIIICYNTWKETTKKKLLWEYIGSNDDGFHSILKIMNIIKENAKLTLDEAIRTVKNAMMTYKYMVMDDVKDILKDQADRVGDRLDTVDKWFTGKGSNPWAYSSMKAKWTSFIKGSTEKAVGKMKSFVVDWTEKIEEVLPKDTTNDANVPGRVALRKKIVELRKAVDDLPAWTSPW
ncbi:hypothetical protein CkaCkLH20_07429 [Colletotrichum karsti]|uniref:Uncharacterized protein n=1 Tax=Colletotrichum karsti TaxID=1095194 RepID=A0A9P6I2B5_9PEZI|nr:uncharacterized protein CkaCkLH20_07429 [Colletotrichum karsti]KAF9875163.1 hypothetical protein CkaCkLH20_07429 [Colletotrichum karsti]